MDDKTLGLMALEIYFVYEWHDETFENSLTMDDIEIVIEKVVSKAADLGLKDEHKGLIKSLVLMNMTNDKARDTYDEISTYQKVHDFMDYHDIDFSDDGKII